MSRTLSILAALAALAVSAAPVASAGPSKAKVPRPGVGSFSIDIGTSEKLRVNARVWHEAARNGIVGSDHAWGNYHSRAVAAAPVATARTSKVKDGLSNTLMVAD